MNSAGISEQCVWLSRSLHSILFLLLGVCMGWVPFNMILLLNIETRSCITTFCHMCACVHLYQTDPKINGLVLLYFAKRHSEPHGNAQSTPKMSVSSLWTFYFAVLHNTCHHQTSSLTFPWSALKINRICTHDGWWIKQLIHAFMIQVVSITWSQ